MSFLAKCGPDQTYEEHIRQVYQSWHGLVASRKRLIARVCNRHCIAPERFLTSSLLTVAFHDIGKLSENFQRMMHARTDHERHRAMQGNFRHEYASVAFVWEGAKALARERGPLSPKQPDVPLEAMAVLGHHKSVNARLDRFQRECDRPERLEWTPGGIAEGLRVARRIFENEGIPMPSLDIRHCEVLARKYPKFVVELSENVKEPEGIRGLFALTKGLLMTADWCGSCGVPDYPTSVRVGPQGVEQHLVEKGRQEGWAFRGFREFQKACGDADGHVVALAPTGSGKTEAALLWALGQVQRGHAGKILYLLPTMVTANSLHTRLERFFRSHAHRVGLTHSLADLVTREEEEGEEGTGREADRRADLLFERHFFPPVTVGTVDQLLTTLFHSGRWALKTFAALDSAIILDEIHAYDPYTTGLISKAIQQLGEAGARFMVMTATMPQPLANGLKRMMELSGPVGMVCDHELLRSSRSLYTLIDAELPDHLNEVRSRVASGKRTLVVVNTVARCQQLAQELRGLNPVCYHSKFILRDREEKEKLILERKPALLIATQVVEVALDIDFDVLLTECAPPDAIAQRAGRINRRRERTGEVIVFRPGPGSDRIYFEDTRAETRPGDSLLERSFRAFSELSGSSPTEQDLLDLVEQVYARGSAQDHPDFDWARRLVENDQNKLCGILDPIGEDDENRLTRLDRYRQVSVIPLSFRRDVLQLERPRDRRKYEVKMPVWYVRSRSVGDEQGLLLCEMDYDRYLGARLATQDGLRMF